MKFSWTYERIWMAIFVVLSLFAAGNALRAVFLDVSEFSQRTYIASPAVAVWPFLTEFDLRKRWQSGLTDIVPMTGDPAGEGSTALLMFRASGESSRVEEEILTALAPNELIVVNRTMRAEDRIEWHLTPVPGGTEVHCRVTRRNNSFADRYLAFWVDWQDARALRGQLQRLAEIAAQ